MSTHAAIAAQVERSSRQTDIVHADLADFDSAPQSWSVALPPEDAARWSLAPAATASE
jgi:hypothetical protein